MAKQLLLCLFAIVSLFAVPSFAAASFSGTLGVAATVSANTETTITYGISALVGPNLVITVNQNANVTLAVFVSITGSLPAGFTSLSFGANVGYTLQVQPASAVVISASLVTPGLVVSSAALITESVTAGCLQFDSTTNAYSYVDFPSYDILSQQITIPIPGAGTYVFVAMQFNTPLPTFYKIVRHLMAEVNYTLTFTMGLTLQVTASANATLNTTFYTSNPAPESPSGELSLGAWFDFDMSSTSSAVNATIQYAYNQSQLIAAGINDATTIKIGFYDTTSASWSFMSTGGSVDTTTDVAAQVTTHFSTWGVYASASSTSAGTSSMSSTTSMSSSAAKNSFALLLLLLLLSLLATAL